MDLWDYFNENSKSNNLASKSGTGINGIITAPSSYESGYLSSSSKYVSGCIITYSDMSDFMSGGVCAPTAATNLCRYWFCRDYKKYSKLKYNDNWKNTFNQFYSLMSTSTSNGTLDSNVATAYVKYFNNRNLKCSASLHYGTFSGQSVINEINNNRPCHLILHNHETYKDHSVVAIGYIQYKYRFSNRNYINIVDGWSSNSSRYVCGSCSGSWNYVTVIPQ